MGNRNKNRNQKGNIMSDQSDGQEQQTQEVVQTSQPPVEETPAEGVQKDPVQSQEGGETPPVVDNTPATSFSDTIPPGGVTTPNDANTTSPETSGLPPSTSVNPEISNFFGGAPKVETPPVVAPVVETPAPTPPPAPEPKPEPAPTPVKLADTPVVDDSTKTSKVENQLTDLLAGDGLTPGTRMALQAVVAYEEKMRAGAPMTAKVGGPQQRSLYTAIRSIVTIQSHTEFKKAFTTLLATIVKDRHGVFKPHRINRFLSEAPFGVNELNHYRQLIDALVSLADPATRDIKRKQIDVRLALMGSENTPFFNEVQVNRVLEYFAGNL